MLGDFVEALKKQGFVPRSDVIRKWDHSAVGYINKHYLWRRQTRVELKLQLVKKNQFNHIKQNGGMVSIL